MMGVEIKKIPKIKQFGKEPLKMVKNGVEKGYVTGSIKIIIIGFLKEKLWKVNQ